MPTREAYATLVYGDGPLACAAAVLGRTLRQHDASRDRIAIVKDLLPETRAILEQDGTWKIHSSQRHARRGSGSPRYQAALARKNTLWRLPYERVLYLDADTFLLPDPDGKKGWRAARLNALWQRFPLDGMRGRGGAQLAATGIRPNFYRNLSSLANTCFNGGFLLLRPDATTAQRLDGIDPHLARQRPERATGRRCPGFDQPLLNAAFPPGSWQRIDATTWRSVTHWMASPEEPSTCALNRRQHLLKRADAYHFFHKANPWENIYCALCVQSGFRCRPVVPSTQECPIQALAQQLWWRLLMNQLPDNATASCLKHTEQIFEDARGPLGSRPREARLRAGLCTGCANRPTPACSTDWDGRAGRTTANMAGRLLT